MDPERVNVIYDVRRRLRKGHSEDVFHKAITLGGYSAGAAAMLFALHLTMARTLGPADYAAFGTYTAIIFTLFFVLTSIHLVITRFVSYHRSRSQYEQIAYIVTRAMRVLFIAGGIGFLSIIILADEISVFFGLSTIAPTVVLGFVLWFTMLVPVYEGAFKGLEEFRKLGRFRLIEAALRALFAASLVLLGFHVAGALFGLGLGTFAALAFNYHHITGIQRLNTHRPDTGQIRRFMVPMVLAMGSLALLLNLDIILVKHYFAPDLAGAFAAASLIAKVPFFIAMVFVGVIFPKVTELHADGKNSAPVLRNALQVVVPVVALFTLLGFFIAGPVFKTLFGEAYVMGPALGFYAFGMGLLAIATLIIAYMLAVRKDNVAWALPAFLLLLLLALVAFHGSLLQVMIGVMMVNASVVAYTLYYARNALEFDYFL